LLENVITDALRLFTTRAFGAKLLPVACTRLPRNLKPSTRFLKSTDAIQVF